jgi:DNA-binding response OmpR family regulator
VQLIGGKETMQALAKNDDILGRNRHQKINVLMVDNEPVHLDWASRALFLQGYNCLGAQSGEEAVKLLNGPDGLSIDILLTGMTLPGRTGLDLVRQVRRTRPTLPIIVVTGLRFSRVLNEIRGMDIPVIHKPVKSVLLDQTIQWRLVSDKDAKISPQSRKAKVIDPPRKPYLTSSGEATSPGDLS